MMQCYPGSTNMYCKTDKDIVSPVAGESAQYREMTPFDRIRGVTDTNRNATQTKNNNREVSRLNAVRMKMIGQSSLSDSAPEEQSYQQPRPGREVSDGFRRHAARYWRVWDVPGYAVHMAGTVCFLCVRSDPRGTLMVTGAYGPDRGAKVSVSTNLV